MSDEKIIIEITEDEVFPVMGHEVVKGGQTWGALRRVSPAELAKLDLLEKMSRAAKSEYLTALDAIFDDEGATVSIEEARNGKR